MTTLFRLLLLTAVAAPTQAFAVRSDWVQADEAEMRLLLVGQHDETVSGGVELLLEPDWYTYWRNPGEAGVPPVFDFSGSINVAGVEVLYPAPTRYDDGTSVSLVYRDEVVFPLVITPAEPDKPITLQVDLTFGVCSTVCIPTRASAAASIDPDAPRDPLAEARLRSFAQLVPRAPEPGRFEITSVAATEDALTIDVRMPDSTYSDLFANPPEGWYIGQPTFVSREAGVSRYRLSLAGKPRNAEVLGQRFQFVAVTGGEAIEEEIEIH